MLKESSEKYLKKKKKIIIEFNEIKKKRNTD